MPTSPEPDLCLWDRSKEGLLIFISPPLVLCRPVKDETGADAPVVFSVSSMTSVVNMAISDRTTEDTEITEGFAERSTASKVQKSATCGVTSYSIVQGPPLPFEEKQRAFIDYQLSFADTWRYRGVFVGPLGPFLIVPKSTLVGSLLKPSSHAG